MDFDKYPLTLIIIAANVIFSLVGFSNGELLDKAIGWPYYEKKERQYYRFISGGFLHADWPHLIFNMFTFYFFGRILEQYLSAGLGGGTSFIALYFSALIVSGLPSYFKHNEDHDYRSLGASGAVSAVVFATIVFSPWNAIYLYGAVKISAALYAVLYLIYCVYAGRRNIGRTNHDAHLWGSVYGLAFILVLISLLRPDVFSGIVAELRHPSLFGRPDGGE